MLYSNVLMHALARLFTVDLHDHVLAQSCTCAHLHVVVPHTWVLLFYADEGLETNLAALPVSQLSTESRDDDDEQVLADIEDGAGAAAAAGGVAAVGSSVPHDIEEAFSPGLSAVT